MKKKNIIIFLLASILISIIGIFCFMVGREIIEERKLITEMNKLVELDLLNDEIDMNIKTKREYGIIEKTVKDHLKQFSDTGKEVTRLINDKEFSYILTVDNYNSDGPNFEVSKKLITTTYNTATKDLELLITLSDKEYIMQLIYQKDLDQTDYELYEKIMFTNLKDELETAKQQFDKTKSYIKKLCDLKLAALDILSQNPSEWYIEDEEIYIYSDIVRENYNNIIEQIENLKI